MGYGVATQTGISVAIQSIPSMSGNKGLRNGYGATFYENFTDGTNTLDPRITFSRASNATLTNSSGLIQFAPMNLLTFSEQFDNAAWTKTNATVTANNTVAPDGTTTADLVIPTATSGFHNVFQSATLAVATHTLSAYFRASGYNFCGFREGGSGLWATFNLSTGVVVGTSASTTATITPVGNGWFRCSMSYAGTASYPVQLFSIDNSYTSGTPVGYSFSGNGTSGTFIWGAQLEVGSTATTYNPTTVKNLLGFSEDFANAAWTKSNSFIQTNLLTFSEQFDNAAWNKATATVTANTTVAPNGTTTADTLSISTNLSNIAQTVSLGAGTYTFSIWVRSLSFTVAGSLRILLVVDGATQAVTFTPTTEWTRQTFTVTAATSVTSVQAIRGNVYTGDVAIWGAQLVQGSVAGDYQQTTSSALPVMYQAPNGTMTADKLVENTANNQHYVQAGVTVVTGTTYTFSAYVKAGERSRVNMLLAQSTSPFTNNANVTFNLLNGTVSATTAGTGSITAIGNGWYRVAVVAATTATGVLARITTSLTDNSDIYTGDGTSGIYIWGAQLSDSASLDPYVNNPVAAPSSTAYYAPRFDYDPVTLQPRGLLIEEQRTNLLTFSEQFDNAAWTKNAATIAANSVVSPDGTQDADTITADAGTGTIPRVGQISTATVLSTVYTATIYAKRNTHSFVQIYLNNQAAEWANFTLTGNGTASANGSSTATITLVGNGWYRLQFVYTAGGTDRRPFFMLSPSATATRAETWNPVGTESVYIWGAQLEAGAFATSYIPTTSAQVTRSRDIAVVQGSNFSSWYNPNEGSLYASSLAFNQGDSTGNASGVTSLNNTTSSEMMRFDPRRIQVITGNVSQANITSISAIPSGLYRSAFTYASNYVAISTNGSAITPATSVNLPSGVNTMQVGQGLTSGGILNGHIRQIAYYPRRLSNQELMAITS
jgi:hypothetical protein